VIRAVVALLSSVLILAFANDARADWFVSSEIKALIVKAEAGDPDAQFRVASAYDLGKGAPRDGVEAMKWYRKAAEAGHAEAQNSVGSGLQAETRYEEALPWYEKAAQQGHALATNNLANLYDEGLGTRQDRRKGFDLYSRAADLGSAEAMWNIALMHDRGELGKRDPVAACIWTVRAAKYATPSDRRLRNELRKAMPALERSLSAADLTLCKEQSDSWTPVTLRASMPDGRVPGAMPQQ
jgi:uncharacterized protein